MKQSYGVLILSLGIVSFLGFGCLSGIPAWLMANVSLRNMDAGAIDSQDRGIVVAGRILGILGTILSVIASLFGLVAILGWIGYFSFVQQAAK